MWNSVGVSLWWLLPLTLAAVATALASAGAAGLRRERGRVDAASAATRSATTMVVSARPPVPPP